MAKIQRKKRYSSDTRDSTPKAMDLPPTETNNPRAIDALPERKKRKAIRRINAGPNAEITNDAPRKYRQLLAFMDAHKTRRKEKKRVKKQQAKTKGKKHTDGVQEVAGVPRNENETPRQYRIRSENILRKQKILAAKKETKTYQKKKQFLLDKKQKKKDKRSGNNKDEYERERVEFGDVVQAPPKLNVIPKNVFKQKF